MLVNGVVYWGEYELSLQELEALPTLIEGQADDCKIQTDTERVWLSRCTEADGEPWDNKVTVERYIAGSWVEVEWWEAKVAFEDDEDEDECPYDTFTLKLDMGGAAMREPADVIDALKRVVAMMEAGAYGATILDNNGNTTGSYEFE
jgi:hypothetical protein